MSSKITDSPFSLKILKSLTVGHGRNAVLGDTIANILEWVGYDVTREYYFNSSDMDLTFARLSLCLATKIVIANGLKILGISRPEKM